MSLITHGGACGVRVLVAALLGIGLASCESSTATGPTKEPPRGSQNDDDEQADDDTTKAPSKPATRDAGKPASGANSGGDVPTSSDDDEAETPSPGLDGGAGNPATGADEPFCNVLEIMQTKCGECHGKELAYGAPMSLTSYDDFTAAAPINKSKKVYEEIGTRVHDKARPMPPTGQPALTPDELATIDAWVSSKAAAPSGTCAAIETPGKPGGEIEVVDWPADCEEKFKFLANDNGKPHKVAPNYEGYVDFYYEMPWKDSVQAVAFRPHTDNKKVLHHWILYQGENSFLNGWSPGKKEKTLPADVGVHMPAGGSGRLKMTTHYNNKSAGATVEEDQSGVEVCITRKPRKNTAFTFPFTASASAPAGRTVSNENSCTVKTDKEIHLVTSSPHMHKLGVHAKFEVIRTDGKREVIWDKPFDFENQTDEVIDVVLKNGDKVSVTCGYKNDTTRNVSFGQNTDQEMCFNFALYYPMCGMTCTGGDAFAAAISQSQGGGCPTGAR